MITDCPRPPVPRTRVRRKDLRVVLPALQAKDPFSCLSAGSAPTAKLRPTCPGKKVVLSGAKTPDCKSQMFQFSIHSVLPLCQKAPPTLAPVKVRRRCPSLVKSNSLQTLRPCTPSFRTEEASSEMTSPCPTERSSDEKPSVKLALLKSVRSVEVSFGGVI